MHPRSLTWRFLLPVCLGSALLCAVSVYGIVKLTARRRTPAPALTPEPPAVVAAPTPEPPARVRPAAVPVAAPLAPNIRPRSPEPRPASHVTRTEPAGNPSLPADVQEKVNAAVERGLKHLRGRQKPSGTWADQHPVALAALPGLTLLECGVPASDAGVQ
ncbi:MAG: hypothetical protein ACRC33_22345, partial [Gemmataceae bacterium]